MQPPFDQLQTPLCTQTNKHTFDPIQLPVTALYKKTNEQTFKHKSTLHTSTCFQIL